MHEAGVPRLTDADFDRVVQSSPSGRHAAVGLAVGAASTCWSNLSGAGTFQSDQAGQICADLIRYLGIER